jgi:hypothetical protein
VRWITPLPRSVTRPVTIAFLIVWMATMAVLVNRSYLQANSSNLASDLARYGSGAQWRGVYYRGEKIGFTVSQTVPLDNADGFELQEDGRLQMTLLGATTAARVRTTARVDRSFTVRSFEFSLDPGTGATEVRGVVDGTAVDLTVTTRAGTRTERRQLAEAPLLSLNVGRRLAAAGIRPGQRHELMVFDPATLRNAPMILTVGNREVVRREAVPIPAFRVEMDFSGLRTTSWITDTGEIIREESPMGMITMRESPEQARAMAVPGQVRFDLLRLSAVMPRGRLRLDNPRDVKRVRMRVEGVTLAGDDLQGVGQSVSSNIVELRDPRDLAPGEREPGVEKYLAPEPFIESDAPEIRAEANAAVQTAVGARARAERLTRHVNAILEKKPTVSLPSALEVLRTRVGDCNEHTALYVAMARSIGIPSRIAVGLTAIHGAFYYHAWPEVYIEERGRGLWLPVDPTLNQFPADATHFRITRGGLDRQAAIVPLIGKMRMTVLDLDLAPGTQQVLVGPSVPGELPDLALPMPQGEPGGCWYLPSSTARRPPSTGSGQRQ